MSQLCLVLIVVDPHSLPSWTFADPLCYVRSCFLVEKYYLSTALYHSQLNSFREFLQEQSKNRQYRIEYGQFSKYRPSYSFLSIPDIFLVKEIIVTICKVIISMLAVFVDTAPCMGRHILPVTSLFAYHCPDFTEEITSF